MKYVSALLSLQTVLCLDLVLLLGAAVPDTQSIRPYFNALVAALFAGLAAIGYGYFLTTRRRRGEALAAVPLAGSA